MNQSAVVNKNLNVELHTTVRHSHFNHVPNRHAPSMLFFISANDDSVFLKIKKNIFPAQRDLVIASHLIVILILFQKY